MNDAALLLEHSEINFAGDARNNGVSHLALSENALPARIEMLKNVALNLLKEVQVLSALEAADIVQGIKFYDEVERFERELITRALDLTDGHQVRAARLLGLKVTTLNSKVKRYGISLPHNAKEEAARPFPKPVD